MNSKQFASVGVVAVLVAGGCAPHAPMNASGGASATGVTEFVVGTGGTSLTGFRTTKPANNVVRNAATHGVLKLTLREVGYDWQFIPIAGQTFTDTGSGDCH